MSKVRFIIVSVLALLAVGAVASASASAHEFKNNGVGITGTLSVLSEGGLFQLIAGAKVVDCEKVTDSGTVLTGGRDLAAEIHFLNCKTGQSGCDVHSPTAPNGLILVANVPTLLVERENSSKVKVLADEFKENATTKEFVTLLFLALSGGSCSEYGTETKVKGQVAAVVNNGTESLEFTNPELKGNTLEAFGVAAKLFGTDKQMFTNGGTLTAS
jgi:hypothetical protein